MCSARETATEKVDAAVAAAAAERATVRRELEAAKRAAEAAAVRAEERQECVEGLQEKLQRAQEVCDVVWCLGRVGGGGGVDVRNI